MADADYTFLQRQNERILSEQANMRDELTVLIAMVTRLEGSNATIIQELRVMQRQFSRMNDRINKLEDVQPS